MSFKAVVQNGRLVLMNAPTQLPEGTVIELVPTFSGVSSTSNSSSKRRTARYSASTARRGKSAQSSSIPSDRIKPVSAASAQRKAAVKWIRPPASVSIHATRDCEM